MGLYTVKAPGQLRFIGFQVSGVPPTGFHEGPIVDLYELRQAAVECAQRLHRDGWRNITCAEVNEDGWGRSFNPLKWEAS